MVSLYPVMCDNHDAERFKAGLLEPKYRPSTKGVISALTSVKKTL